MGQTLFRARALGWTLALALVGLAPAQAGEESRGDWPQPDPTPIDLLSLEAPALEGEQVERYRRLQDLPETAEHRAATFEREALATARVLRLRLFDGTEVVFVRDEAQLREEILTWRGHAEDEPGTAILVAREDELSGSVSLDRGREGSSEILAIDALGGGAVMVRRLDLEPLGALGCGAPDADEHEAHARLPETPGTGPCTTNVLAVYTPAAQRAHGNIPLLAQLAIAKANQAHADGKTDSQRLNLIGTRQVDYTESHKQTGELPTDLVRLQDRGDGFLDEIHSWREELGADVVVLITESLPSGLGGAASAVLAGEDTAFAVVLWNAAVNDFFAHEVGHLQGVRHDPEESDRATMDRNACRVARLKTTLNGWTYLWGSGSGTIGGWYLGVKDDFVVGDFNGDGDDEVLATNSDTDSSRLLNYNGANWVTQWNNFSDGWIGTWMLGAADQITAGNFDIYHAGDELLLVNHLSRHAQLLSYKPQLNSWVRIWSNNGDGWVKSWWLGTADRFLSAPFEADFSDELIVISALSQHAHLLPYSDMIWVYWTTLWTNAGNDQIAYWYLGPADSYLAGDFTADPGAELHAINPNGWSHTNSFQGSNWYGEWSNGGSQWIDRWLIGQQDVYVAGNFLSAGRDEILTIAPNNGWSSFMDFDGANWKLRWSNSGGGSIGGWVINQGDRCMAGDFVSGDSRDELLCIQPGNGHSQMQSYQ